MDSTSESDESLVAKARGGDMDALDALVRRHESWVFNLALRMAWRRDVAEDATQEILIKAVTKLSTFAGNSAFRTWLYRIGESGQSVPLCAQGKWLYEEWLAGREQSAILQGSDCVGQGCCC